MRDNDVKYNAHFDNLLRSGGATMKRNTPWSLNLRAHVEQVIQTLKQEVLDAFVVVGERHLNHINCESMAWYNRERRHSARNHLPPGCEKPPEQQVTIKRNEVVCKPRLGGLLKSYPRRAA